MIQIEQVAPQELPLSLLLEADPDENSIRAYLDDAFCFVAKQKDKVVAACVIKAVSIEVCELFNISVSPDKQGLGIGNELLSYVIELLRSEQQYQQIVLGTGTFGYQLMFYQKLGFRVTGVIRDHFLDNYPEPIFEHGLQHKDMLRLTLNLRDE